MHWHSYQAYGATYGVLLSEARTGQLTTALGSPGEVNTGSDTLDTALYSKLYRWQGLWVEVQVCLCLGCICILWAQNIVKIVIYSFYMQYKNISCIK